MIKYSIPILNLGHLAKMLNWYKETFGKDADYDIHSRINVFQPEAEIRFLNQQHLSLFLLKFGEGYA
jgi:hypothetical protein